MKSRNHALAALPALLFLSFPASAALTVTVETSKPKYLPGEPVGILVTTFNDAPADQTVSFGSNIQWSYSLDDIAYFFPLVGAHVETSMVIPANGSKSHSITHFHSSYELPPGSHTVVGHLGRIPHSHLPSPPLAIEVLPPELPTESFLIDFDHIDAGGRQPTDPFEYLRYGVRFDTIREFNYQRSIGAGPDAENHFLVASALKEDISTVIASFEMPVFGLSMDFATVAGQHIQMVARDAAGNIILESNSLFATETNSFGGPWSVQSDVPIAAVEWRASAANTAFFIDNLFIQVPEPTSIALLPLSSIVMLQRRRRPLNS